MKTIQLTKPVARFRFPDELSAAIGTGLITVRLVGPDDGATGEIVVEDAVLDATVQAVVNAHDPTPPTLRQLAIAAFNDAQAEAALRDRAIALAAKKSDNVLRKWTRDFKAAVAAATSLNDLKTRVAALPTLDDITDADLKAAVIGTVNTGEAD